MILKSSIKKSIFTEKNKLKYYAFSLLFVILQIQFIDKTISRENRWSKEIILLVPLVLSLILLFYFIIIKKRKINLKSFVFAMIVVGVTFFTILINQDYSPDNFIFISVIIVAFCISNIFSQESYLRAYVDAMIIYCAFSLVATYILHPIIMQTGTEIFPVYTNSRDVPYSDMGLAYVIKWFGITRNQGYFNEPGVFQFYILVAMIIEIFYLNRKSKKRNVIILFITFLTTFSSAGYLSLVPLVIAILLKKSNKLNWRNIGITIIFGLFLYYLISTNKNISEQLYYTLVTKFGSESNNSSFLVRYESIINLLKMSMQNPVFGSSFVNGYEYIQGNYSSYNSVDITGTLFSFIMALGYPVGLWICFYFYNFCKSIVGGDRFIIFCTFIALFISVNTQNLVYDSVFITLCFVPFMEKRKKRGTQR